MTVEGDVTEGEFLLLVPAVHEGGVKLSLPARAEPFYLYLLREVHVITAEEFEDGFLGAPVNGKLLVAAVVVQVVYLCRSLPRREG